MARTDPGMVPAVANLQARPTISIYQNPEHVAGILQQLHYSPLVIDESREQGTARSSNEKAERKGHAGIKAGVKIPAITDVGADLSGDRSRLVDDGFKADTKTVQKFEYSQAYYLQVVRNALRQQGLIQRVGAARDAEGLRSGAFVEFEATFRPSALHSLLDILTPDLVAALVDHQVKAEGLKVFPEYEEMDKLKIFSEGLYLKAKIRSDIARAAVEAVRVDFRTQNTREFYGSITDITAITICDSAHFTVEDEDRILDGSFSVLGKVTSQVEDNLPILSRNKLLDRLSPKLIDSIFGLLRDGAANQAFKLKLGDDDEHEIENAFDLALPSRVEGPSFKVVPIAIYT